MLSQGRIRPRGPGHVKTAQGGEQDPLEIDDSARQVLETLSGLKVEDLGSFLLYNGTE